MKLKKLLKTDRSSAFWEIKETLEEQDLWDDFLEFFGLIDEEDAEPCMQLDDYCNSSIAEEYALRGLSGVNDLSLTQELFLEEQKEKIRNGEIV